MVVVRVIGRKEVRETWPGRRSEKVLVACTATRCALEAGLRVELRRLRMRARWEKGARVVVDRLIPGGISVLSEPYPVANVAVLLTYAP